MARVAAERARRGHLGRPLLQLPPIPELPEFLRGKSFAVVEAAFLGSEADGRALMKPLRDLGPAMDTFAMVPPVGLAELHMDPPDPLPYASSHVLAGDLPAQAIDEFLAVSGPGSGSPLASVELRHLGGALGRIAPHHGAVSKLPGSFAMFAVGVAPTPEAHAMVSAHAEVRRGHAAAVRGGPRTRTSARRAAAPAQFFGGETWERLRAVKADYDPREPVPREPSDPAGGRRPARLAAA